MFDFIRGTLHAHTPTHVVLENHGIGYHILTPIGLQLPKVGEITTLHTTLIVREDSQTLYGFASPAQRTLFLQVTNVSGIGPKTALALIGHLPESELFGAITNGNTALISRVPGIGKKTAERLILEMRGKVKSNHSPIASDALAALVNLGYKAPAAEKAINSALKKLPPNADLTTLITTSLQIS